MPTPEEIIKHDESPPPPGASPWVGPPPSSTDIDIVESDPQWPAHYQELAGRITAALDDRVLALDHIGSTSVPGLPAKPIIDIDLTVADPADEDAWLQALEEAGFRLVVREPWWHEHRCMVSDEPRSNVHVFGPDSPETVRHRIFRDWLRTHPDDLSRYRDAKVGAAAASNEAGEAVMDYNGRKAPVIREIYDRAFRAAGLL